MEKQIALAKKIRQIDKKKTRRNDRGDSSPSNRD